MERDDPQPTEVKGNAEKLTDHLSQAQRRPRCASEMSPRRRGAQPSSSPSSKQPFLYLRLAQESQELQACCKH